MRTTIRLNEALLAETKKLALETGRTLTAVIEEALRGSLARRKRGTRQSKVRLTTYGSGGLHPGIDLDDSSALLDMMDLPK